VIITLTKVPPNVECGARDRPGSESAHPSGCVEQANDKLSGRQAAIEITAKQLSMGNEVLRDWLGDGKADLTVLNESVDKYVLSILSAVFVQNVTING